MTFNAFYDTFQFSKPILDYLFNMTLMLMIKKCNVSEKWVIFYSHKVAMVKSPTIVSNVFFCFQSTSHVSIIQILFPIYAYVSNVRCIFPTLYTLFPSWSYISKLQCFQCMFPIYMKPYFSLVRVWVRPSNVYRCDKRCGES